MLSSQSRLSILLVEDEPINQKVVQLMLDNIGCTYNSANTGEVALDLAKKNHYDIILMDIQLPDIDGLEVTKQLRAAGINTPIIATTAYSFDDELQNFIKSGMNDVLLKPFRQENIVQLIKKWAAPELETADT